ncbi:hypothetical protein [Clostridium sp. ZBS13]|nr:hypothetical protein [Clostridium sp. ZBS13]
MEFLKLIVESGEWRVYEVFLHFVAEKLINKLKIFHRKINNNSQFSTQQS